MMFISDPSGKNLQSPADALAAAATCSDCTAKFEDNLQATSLVGIEATSYATNAAESSNIGSVSSNAAIVPTIADLTLTPGYDFITYSAVGVEDFYLYSVLIKNPDL